MGLALEDISSQTLLTREEKRLLIPDLISRDDLNTFEAENILQAKKWTMRKSVINKRDIFSSSFIRLLHRRMFNKVWKWAGEYRDSDKNIGVHYLQIPVQLHQLEGDVDYWQNNQTYNNTELAVVVHHRLVKIHPFPDGNGRHARLFADVIIAKYGGKNLTWGKANLTTEGEVRKNYIDALRDADAGKFARLFAFAVS